MAFSIFYQLLRLIILQTTSIAKAIENLTDILESESETSINWFKDNHMIVKSGKFQAIIYDKHKENHTNQIINIDQKEIKAVSKVKFLGVQIDNKLNFNHHINNICKSVSNKFKALIKDLLRFEERKVLLYTFVISNCNFCSLSTLEFLQISIVKQN